jgi:hypothetical protein
MSCEINRSIHRKCCLGQEWICWRGEPSTVLYTSSMNALTNRRLDREVGESISACSDQGCSWEGNNPGNHDLLTPDPE